MLFDGHAHFFSRNFFKFYADAAKQPVDKIAAALGMEVPSEDPAQLADRWVKEMDANGVDRQVMMSSVPGDEASVALAIQRHPSRISGFFMLNPSAPDAQARARRAFDEMGFKGVCLFPTMHHFYPDEERLYPIYEEANRDGGVVFMHFGMLKIPIREKLGLPAVADLRYANPLRLHPACNAFPKLKFIIPHFGCGFLRETMMLGAQAKNLLVDTSSSNTWMDLFPGLTIETVFQCALKNFGPERIIFGTDSSAFPRGWRKDIYQQQKDVLTQLQVKPADQDRIFGKTLAKLTK